MRPRSRSASPSNSSAPFDSSPRLKSRCCGATLRVWQKTMNCFSTSLSLDRVIWMASLKPSASVLLAVTATIRGTGASFFPSTSKCPLPRPRTLIFARVALKMSRMLRPPLPMRMGTRSKSGWLLCRKMWHQRRAAVWRPWRPRLLSDLPLMLSSAACAGALLPELGRSLGEAPPTSAPSSGPSSAEVMVTLMGSGSPGAAVVADRQPRPSRPLRVGDAAPGTISWAKRQSLRQRQYPSAKCLQTLAPFGPTIQPGEAAAASVLAPTVLVSGAGTSEAASGQTSSASGVGAV
mmetsp:Transcript_155267/g.476947  ORF Transcript_155267/g.476947 Transcript_155267/m.476947 type:complete len:292 (+) Transcript_155267:337-1212(+)